MRDYVDFPGSIQIIAVLNCQNELKIARKEWLKHACIFNGSYLKKYLRMRKMP